MKLALVHDHLVQDGGAERVLQSMRELWPEAPVFTLVYDRNTMRDFVNGGEVRTSFLGKVPGATKAYRWFLPFMPAATESYDLSEYDVVISSTSAFAKGIITSPSTLHICYCHTPTRYLWSQTHEYIEDTAPKLTRPLMPPTMNYLRTWDQLAASRVDVFVANSATVAERIAKYYRAESKVIHPPVDTENMQHVPDAADGTYFVAGGRLVAYKRFDLLIDAFNTLGIPLVIFGDGPQMKSLRQRAWPNVRFVGRVSEEEKARLYSGAVAYLHPQEEDFGITAVEAMACGTPVIAYRRGGACETVKEGVSGVFFDTQTPAVIRQTVLAFRPELFNRETVCTEALRFTKPRFNDALRRFVEERYTAWVCKNQIPSTSYLMPGRFS